MGNEVVDAVAAKRSALPGRAGVIVVGAGPAGLAAAAELRRAGCEALVLEATGAPGASWRCRYDRLRLNTSRRMSELPGLSIPREAGRWVRRDDYVAYLERYVEHHQIAVAYETTAERLDRVAGGWEVATSTGRVRAGAVVLATGWDRLPVIPAWPGLDGYSGQVLHAGVYAVPQPFAGRSVLVAGAGSTGLELCVDLVEGGARRVRLAVRTPPNHVPRQMLGLPLSAVAGLADRLPTAVSDALGRALVHVAHGDLSAYGLPPAPHGVATTLARTGKGPAVVDGFTQKLRRGEVEVVAAVARLEHDEVVLADGSRVRPDALIAATGYRRGLEGPVGHLGILGEDGAPDLDALPAGLHAVGYRLPISGQLPALRRDARAIARAVAAVRR